MRRVVPTFVLLGALALAGCAADTSTKDTATSAPTTAPATTAAPLTPSASGSASAKPAVPGRLAFTAKTLDGAAFDATILAGKPVVLWFWAPWCPKCRAAGPEVAKTAEKHQGKVAVVGVAGLSDDTDSMRGFVAATKTGEMTHLADGTGAVWKRFGVTAQHTYVLIGADGGVIHKGALSNNELERRVAALAG
jgi:thiol-disulfide isomerase/thioredoxin